MKSHRATANIKKKTVSPRGEGDDRKRRKSKKKEDVTIKEAQMDSKGCSKKDVSNEWVTHRKTQFVTIDKSEAKGGDK